MHRPDPDLLDAIMAFDIDGDDPDFTFSRRLARESGWSIEFAQRVVDEYKRFVYLCMVSGHPCTPSEHVDQAWHLHLTYTRSYWERFCGEVLPRPLHHNPTRGGERENAKFDDWYARTKDSYRALIGEEPPSDIWTPPAERFGRDLAWSRVNHADSYVIPKRLLRRGVLAGFAAGALLFVAAGSTQPPSAAPTNFSAETARLVLMAIGGAGALLGALVAHRACRGWDALERGVAYLSGALIGAGALVLLACALDRSQFVHLGIPQKVNNPASMIGLVTLVGGFLFLAFIPGALNGSGGGGGGGCGGCGGGGCGGCGGCGG